MERSKEFNFFFSIAFPLNFILNRALFLVSFAYLVLILALIDGLIMAHLNFAVLACWFVPVTTYRLKLKNYPNELWDEMMNTIQAQVVVTAMEEDADGDRINVRLLLYSDDAKPAGWFCQEEANKEFALENPILFVAFHGLRLSVSLALHNSIRHGIFKCLKQSFKDRFQKLM